MQRSFCLGDVRCPRIWAGYRRRIDRRRLPFGDLAADPCVLRKGTCGPPDDRRRQQRGVRRRVAARDLTVTAKPPATDIPEGFVPLFRTSLFLDALGPFFYRPTKSSFVIGLRVATKHANARGSAHGGLLLTLVDIALGYTGSASSD